MQTEQTKARSITLKEGNTLTLKEEKMNISFIKIVEDSRCPKGANCIWSGVAVSEIEFLGKYSRPRTILLSSAESPNKEYKTIATYQGYIIRIEKVLPEKTETKNSSPYTLVLKIEKNKPSLEPTTTQ